MVSFGSVHQIKYDELLFFRKYFDNVTVIYTMNGCGWCTAALPIFKEAVSSAKPSHPVLHVLYDDSPNAISKGESISGFPTVRRYTGNLIRDHTGSRTKQSYNEFLA